MAKGPICVTTFAARSGQEGTPMFSRPGVQTIAEHIVFKNPREISIDEGLGSIPEEVEK